MKRLALVLMVSTLLLVGGPAIAEMCTIDAVPAATLLLPYFEVDTSTTSGVNTIFSINNASAAPALAHVTLWTDWSWPSIDFDIFLTGYDIQVINLYDLFLGGNVTSENADGTITADEQSDTLDLISPHGNNPEWDGSFVGITRDCIDFLPFYENPLVQDSNYDRLVNAHSGQPVAAIGCTGADYGDGVYRGYVTIDNAVQCSTDFATQAGYFGGADPVASNQNQLWGEYFILNSGENYMQGEPLVHIEADDAFAGDANGYTFYSRYVAAVGGADNREPLGATWAARYFNNPVFTGGTSYLVWRDSTSYDIDPTTWSCGAPGEFGAGPSWHPLNEIEVIAFDERENATELCVGGGGGGVISPPTPADPDVVCFPLETQLVSTSEGELASPYSSGWMYLNLGLGIDAPVGDFDPVFAEGAQSYVSVHHSADGRYSVGLQAIELTSACSDSALTLSDICDPTTDPPGPCVPGG